MSTSSSRSSSTAQPGHIFISYATADQPFVEELARQLKRRHFKTWRYQVDAPPGENIYQAARQAITEAWLIIVVLSQNSVESAWVLRETVEAERQQKSIIPLRYDDIAEGTLLFQLQGRNWIDAQPPRSPRDYMPDLLRRVSEGGNQNDKTLLDARLTTQTNNKRPQHIRWPGRLWLALVAIMGIIVIVLLFLGWNHSLWTMLSPETIKGRFTPNSPPPVRFPVSQDLSYYGDRANNTTGAKFDHDLALRFGMDTGMRVGVFNPKEEERLAGLQEAFAQQSAEYDVVMIDIVWTGALAPHLLDLTPFFQQEVAQHDPAIIANNTVDGKLVAIPWFADFGMLYYRDDLLAKYNFNAPPMTWDELTIMATTIQQGERATNPDFVGFAWQGAAYEGLTCNALEWIASEGGGTLLDPVTGQVTLNNPTVIHVLDRAQAWVQGPDPISRGVLDDKEEESLDRFRSGNAAFLRMWPNAYAKLEQTNVPFTFQIAPLPSAPGLPGVGVVGGWQLAVPRYSRNQQAAIEFIRYMTSAEVQKWRALRGAYVPAIDMSATDPKVSTTMPFLNLNIQRIPRPSSQLGANYETASDCFSRKVHQILTGRPAQDVVPEIEQECFLSGGSS